MAYPRQEQTLAMCSQADIDKMKDLWDRYHDPKIVAQATGFLVSTVRQFVKDMNLKGDTVQLSEKESITVLQDQVRSFILSNMSQRAGNQLRIIKAIEKELLKLAKKVTTTQGVLEVARSMKELSAVTDSLLAMTKGGEKSVGVADGQQQKGQQQVGAAVLVQVMSGVPASGRATINIDPPA